MEGEYGSFSKEVAQILDINPNTLRRWSIELENAGYEFSRNEKNQRIYYERDISALIHFKTLIDKTNNLENTAKAVVSKVNEKNNAEKMLSVIVKNDDNLTLSKDELKELIEESVEKAISKEREAMFKALEMKMNDTIEMQSRVLMKTIRDQQEETQKMIAAAEEEKKKGFWSKLFKK